MKTEQMRRAFKKELEEAKATSGEVEERSDEDWDKLQKTRADLEESRAEVDELRNRQDRMWRDFQKELEEAKANSGLTRGGGDATELQNLVASLKDKEAELEEVKNNAEHMRRAFQKKLEEAKAQSASATGEGGGSDKLQKAIEDLNIMHEAELDELTSRQEQMRKAFQRELEEAKANAASTAEVQNRDIPAGRATANEELEQLQHKLRAVMVQNETRMTEVQQWKDSYAAQKKELDRLRRAEKSQTSDQGGSEELRKRIAELEKGNFEVNDQFLEERRQLEEEKYKLSEEAAILKKAVDTHRKNLCKERAEYLEEMEKQHNEMKALRNELDREGPEAAAFAVVQEQRNNLLEETQKLREEVIELNTDKQKLQAMKDERADMESEIQRLREAGLMYQSSVIASSEAGSVRMTDEIRNLKTKLHAAQQAQQRYMKASKEIENLRLKLREQEQTIQRMQQAQISGVSVNDAEENKHYRTELAKMEETIGELRGRNRAYLEQLDEAAQTQRQLQIKEQEVNLLQDKLADNEETMSLLSSTQELLCDKEEALQEKEEALMEKDMHIARLQERIQVLAAYPTPDEPSAQVGAYPTSTYSSRDNTGRGGMMHDTPGPEKSMPDRAPRVFGQQFTQEMLKRRQETVEKILENWDSEYLIDMIASHFKECDIGDKDFLDWNSGECREFLLSLFRAQSLPPPDFPLIVFRQIYSEVWIRNAIELKNYDDTNCKRRPRIFRYPGPKLEGGYRFCQKGSHHDQGLQT